MPLHRPKKKAMPKKITLKIKDTIAMFSGRFDDTVSVTYYLRNSPDVLFIDAREVQEILDHSDREFFGGRQIPRQGYVWVNEVKCEFCGTIHNHGENCPGCQNPRN